MADSIEAFGNHYSDMCRLMDACHGWPDVDLWCCSSIREWWNEANSTSDAREMIEVIHRCGMRPIVNPIASCDEIRQEVDYQDFIRAAEAEVDRYECGWEPHEMKDQVAK